MFDVFYSLGQSKLVLFSDACDPEFCGGSPGATIDLGESPDQDIASFDWLAGNCLGGLSLSKGGCGRRFRKAVRLIADGEVAPGDCPIPATVLPGEIVEAADGVLGSEVDH